MQLQEEWEICTRGYLIFQEEKDYSQMFFPWTSFFPWEKIEHTILPLLEIKFTGWIKKALAESTWQKKIPSFPKGNWSWRREKCHVRDCYWTRFILMCSMPRCWDTDICNKERDYLQDSQVKRQENKSQICLLEARGLRCTTYYLKKQGSIRHGGKWLEVEKK